MLKTLVIVVIALVVFVLLFATTRPDTFRVERSARIKAPAATIFALLDDFRRWPEWSPWEKLDPAMQRTLSGPARATGAAYAWDGNKQVGQGRMEIIGAEPPSHLVIKLDFLRPFEAHNTAEFTLTAAGDDTEVLWAMHGPMPYISKLMSVFVSMDRMVGPDFERGLANLKALAEAPAAAP